MTNSPGSCAEILRGLARAALPAVAVVLAAGCASRAPAPRIEVAGKCTRSFVLASSQRIGLDAENPVEWRFDDTSPCVASSAGGNAVYAVFRLPSFEKPYIVNIDSAPVGESLFAPEALTLDAAGKVRRTLPWDRFSTRGQLVNASLFVNADDAEERYLVVRSAVQVVGQKGQRIDSGSFFLPFLTAVLPVFYMHGTETERQYVLSHNGLVRLQANTVGRQRRGATQQNGVRDELGNRR